MLTRLAPKYFWVHTIKAHQVHNVGVSHLIQRRRLHSGAPSPHALALSGAEMLTLSLLRLSSSFSKSSPFDLPNSRLFPLLPRTISIGGPDLSCRSRLPHRRCKILRSRSEMDFHVPTFPSVSSFHFPVSVSPC